MTRLFTFGCSMTNYSWPTWADIIGFEINHQNWGMQGIGNVGIFSQLIEAGYKNKIGPRDKVIVMWTFLGREDRYVKDKWLQGSGVHTNRIYDNNWIEKYFCEKGSLIKELACISAAAHTLNDWGCDWKFLSVDEIIGAAAYKKGHYLNPDEAKTDHKNFLYALEKNDFKLLNHVNKNIDTNVLNTYIDTFKKLSRPSLYRFLLDKYNSDIPVKLKFYDPHPTPGVFLEYVKTIFPDYKISDKCNKWILDWDRVVVSSSSPDNLGWNKSVERF